MSAFAPHKRELTRAHATRDTVRGRVQVLRGGNDSARISYQTRLTLFVVERDLTEPPLPSDRV